MSVLFVHKQILRNFQIAFFGILILSSSIFIQGPGGWKGSGPFGRDGWTWSRSQERGGSPGVSGEPGHRIPFRMLP